MKETLYTNTSRLCEYNYFEILNIHFVMNIKTLQVSYDESLPDDDLIAIQHLYGKNKVQDVQKNILKTFTSSESHLNENPASGYATFILNLFHV